MDSWIKKIHHPELFCTRDYVKSTVNCHQEPYNYHFEYKIPVNYAKWPIDELHNFSNINWFNSSSVLIPGLSFYESFYILNLEQVGKHTQLQCFIDCII